jgi:group II intron reverse transcriptase/maturase
MAKTRGGERESEGLIVPTMGAPHNALGGKGPCGVDASLKTAGEGMARKAPNHPEERQLREQVRRLQVKLFVAAKRCESRRFHALYDRVHRPDVLWVAWFNVKRNKGAAGVDGVTLEAVEQYGVERLLSELQDELRAGKYVPPPVLRRYIPKPDGKQRPLGIPTVADRVVQAAVKLVLEPIFEAGFEATSYGFRPKRGTLEALEDIRETVNSGCDFVFDADIKDYFGSLSHEVLLEQVEKRVSDRRAVNLIRRWLRAGVLEDGRRTEMPSGTPQGGVISPLLSNVYLHVLDTEWRREHAAVGRIVRYADDFLVMCRNREAVEEAERRVKSIFVRLKLSLHPEKSRKVCLTDGKEGFDFLGCHLHKRLSGRMLERNGLRRYYLQRWPSMRSMKRVKARLHELTDGRRNGVKDVRVLIENLNPVLKGWGSYFRTGNAAKKFLQVDHYVVARLRNFLVRRKGRNLKPGEARQWERPWFEAHGLHRLRGTVKYPKPCLLNENNTGKPYAGNPRVRFERRRVETGRA